MDPGWASIATNQILFLRIFSEGNHADITVVSLFESLVAVGTDTLVLKPFSFGFGLNGLQDGLAVVTRNARWAEPREFGYFFQRRVQAISVACFIAHLADDNLGLIRGLVASRANLAVRTLPFRSE